MQSVNNDRHNLSSHHDARQSDAARVLVVGEVLWDRFPNSTRLGGAPLNFSVHLNRLKHSPRLVSAIGTDATGVEARRAIHVLDLDASLVQSTSRYRTGSATVHIGSEGQTSFTIERPAAYDGIKLSDGITQQLIEWNPSWLYYGTLFPSYPSSRELLFRLFRTLPHAARFYDLNMRPGFDCPDLIETLLGSAAVVKLNEEELRVVHAFTGLPAEPEAFCRAGVDRYHWRAVCVTLGVRGCAMLVTGDYVEADGFPVDVADTVGAGDAFAAAFLHGLISNWPAAKIAEFSNRIGAFVASIHGAIPDHTPDAILNI